MARAKRTKLYSQTEYDNLSDDMKSFIKNKQPELLLNVSYKYYGKIHNPGDPVLYIDTSEIEDDEPKYRPNTRQYEGVIRTDHAAEARRLYGDKINRPIYTKEFHFGSS